MRIRSIAVANWACIETLDLPDLAPGLVILHGPNRTGKSSLVQAIRSCLFDHQHDSSDSTISAAIPWRSKANPHVAIEFEHAGERYRISKTYGKARFGDAQLEQLTPAGWTVLVRGKDASRKTREIIGAENSVGGIFQMLWLNQHEFRLPEQKELDPSLKKSLETVLGSLITGPDVDFKQRLDQTCGRWFTATMKDRKESPMLRLAEQVRQAQIAFDEIEGQYHEAETALGEYEEATARQPALRRDQQQAEDELAKLQAEKQAFEVRKARHDLAERNRVQAEQLLAEAERRLAAWSADRQRAEQIEQWLAEHAGADGDAAIENAKKTAAAARAKLEQAESAVEQLRLEKSACNDRVQLARLEQSRQALMQAAGQCEEHAGKLAKAKTGQQPPSVKEIDDLRRNREEAVQLQAQLDAAEIQVTLHAKKAVEIKANIDDKPGKSAALAKGKQQRWQVRQNVELAIGDLATIRIGRGKEDRAIEEIASQLADLESVFAERMKKAKAESIDELVQRRGAHEAALKECKEHEAALARLAPAGLPALQADIARLERDIAALRTRRPELAKAPTQGGADLDRQQAELAKREASLTGALQSARQACGQAEQALEAARESQRSAKIAAAERSAALQQLKEKLGREDQTALAAVVADAQTRLADAQAKADESALGGAEQAIDSRLQAAHHAQRQRALAVRENEDLLLRLQTQLAGAEGLHQRRIQAEQTLMDLKRSFERESLQARAHRHVKELFEEIQQGQTRAAVGPVNERVMHWARQLGLTDYAGLHFDGQLLPAGLQSIHAPASAPIQLDQESLGTVEQLSLLIRLAVGGLLASDEPAVALLDDPLAYADLGKHEKMLQILQSAARGDGAGPLQIILLTCHPERFANLSGAQLIDLSAQIRRGD